MFNQSGDVKIICQQVEKKKKIGVIIVLPE